VAGLQQFYKEDGLALYICAMSLEDGQTGCRKSMVSSKRNITDFPLTYKQYNRFCVGQTLFKNEVFTDYHSSLYWNLIFFLLLDKGGQKEREHVLQASLQVFCSDVIEDCCILGTSA